MAINLTCKLRGKNVVVQNNIIFVNGSRTGIRFWDGSSTRYIKVASGQEISHLKGKKLEDALVIEGHI